MTKSSHWLVASALACFAALSACGSKNSNTGGGSSTGNTGNAVACLGQALTGACQSCIQGSCEGALGSFASDCSEYLQCYCPNGAYNGSAQTSQACVSKVTANPSCLSSAQSVNTCLQQNCTTACQGSGGSSSGGGGGSGGGSGGSGGGSSSGAGGMTPACGVVFTTASCASCVMSKCCSVTQSCASDEGCLAIITCIHGCSNDTKCEQNCVTSAPASAQMELNNAGACWTSSCNGSGC